MCFSKLILPNSFIQILKLLHSYVEDSVGFAPGFNAVVSPKHARTKG